MKSFLLILLILITICALNAQNFSNRDSLLKAYTSAELTDTVKSLLASSIARSLRFTNPDSAFLFACEAYNWATKSEFSKGIALSLNFKGLIMKDQGKIASAITYFRTSIQYYLKTGNTQRAANGYNNIGLTWDDAGKQQEALACYDSALKLYKKIDDWEHIAETLNNFGQNQRKHGNYYKSLEHYFKSLEIYESHNASNGPIKMVLGNIGVVYEKMEKYREAITYYNRSLEITSPDDAIGRATTLTNLGNAYELEGKFAEAEGAHTEALRLFKKASYREGIAANSVMLAHLKIKKGELSESLRILSESLSIVIQIEHREGQAICYNYFAEAYIKLGSFEKAFDSSLRALKISEQYRIPEQKDQALQNLAEIYIHKGDYKNGYELFEKHISFKDSLFSKKKLEQVYELEKMYELNKKQSEIDLLAKQNEIQSLLLVREKETRLFLFTGLVVTITICIVIYFINRSKSKLSNQLSLKNKFIERINIDLKAQALRAQMNPHFIFNSLNSIQFLIMKLESTRAFDYLAKFALLLRKVMDNSEKDLITLEEEIEVLNLYLQLESLRVDGSFEYKIESSVENLNVSKIPPLVVQPYIENAIHHGLLPKNGDRKLSVTFSQRAKTLLCEVRDNGIGRAEAMEISKRKNKIFSSKGMEYTAKRIDVMNNLMGKKSEVTVIDLYDDEKSNGTLVKILFAYA